MEPIERQTRTKITRAVEIISVVSSVTIHLITVTLLWVCSALQNTN